MLSHLGNDLPYDDDDLDGRQREHLQQEVVTAHGQPIPATTACHVLFFPFISPLPQVGQENGGRDDGGNTYEYG